MLLTTSVTKVIESKKVIVSTTARMLKDKRFKI